MVANNVTIVTKAANGKEEAVQWQSDGS